jgi:hypothetical protein
VSKLAAALGCFAVIVIAASLAPSGWAAPGGAWAYPLLLLLVGAYRGWTGAWTLLMAFLCADALAIVLSNPTDAAVLSERGLPVVVAAGLAYLLRADRSRHAVSAGN